MWNGPLVSSSSHDRRDPGILWVLVTQSYRYLPASNHGNGYVYERWRHLPLPCLISLGEHSILFSLMFDSGWTIWESLGAGWNPSINPGRTQCN
jgi:hypothetical protein